MAALFVLAIALPIAFFQRFLDLPGTGVGLLAIITDRIRTAAAVATSGGQRR